MTVEIRDVAPGLWLWRQPHPDWREGLDWEPEVASVVVESRGVVVVIDPLAPPDDDPVWERLAATPPQSVLILKPDHVRDVDRFVRRYDARGHGPWLFWPHNVPQTPLEPVDPGDELPGGLQALYDGRGRMETPVYLPEQRALVFADGMTAPGGALRVCVSHGEPVHTRADFEAALERRPWGL